jgi:hypothetical protein
VNKIKLDNLSFEEYKPTHSFPFQKSRLELILL